MTKTQFTAQGTVRGTLMETYAEKLCRKITAKIETSGKQSALILKPNPCYKIMILKYALVSIVGKQQKQIELKTQ